MKKHSNMWLLILALVTATYLGVHIFVGSRQENVISIDNINVENSNDSGLWIITERTVEDGMNYQAELVVESLKRKYPNMDVNLDILPTKEPERTAYISQLHALIERGQGPDLFLLPTNEVLTLDEPKQYTYVQVEPLFSSVEVQMRMGTFLDVRDFFNKDESINKQALVNGIIDSCVIDGHQYVIPLRYDAPVLYVFEDVLDNKIDPGVFSLGFDQWMETVVEMQDPVLACGAEFNSINVFSNLIDYDEKKVILSEKDMADYLQTYQNVEALIGKEISHRTSASITGYIVGFWKPFPVQVGRLSQAIYYSLISNCENRELSIYPIRSIEGKTFATVSYYAAIASYCKNPELAYECISLLLSEEFQWEINRPTPVAGQYPGLIESSCPVLAAGSVAPLLESLKCQVDRNYRESNNDSVETRSSKKDRILKQTLEEASIPVWYTEYDCVVFPFMMRKRFDAILSELNDFSLGNIPQNVDISELAKEVVENLQLELTS